MPKIITLNGNLSEWAASDLINFGDGTGYSIYATAQDGTYYFGIGGPVVIGANTTAWFNTDQNASTGYQIFGFAGGAEFNLNIKSDGTAALYTGGAGETLVLDNIQLAYSADQKSIEFAIPMTALGNPAAIDTVYDINDSFYLPVSYSEKPYTVFDGSAVTRTDPTHRIGIVYSTTTAANYFSATAYGQLFMAVQSQAMQAGISYDLLTEADLKDLAKLANYDALVFPSFANVQAGDVTAITNTLEQATRQFGIGLITAGNFMTNNETGAALAGDSYARMKLLFDATRVTGGFPADVAINSSDVNQVVLTTMAPGESIHSYTQIAWDAFQSVSGTGQTIATETVGGQTYAAALATQTTGGKNVLFSTAGVMADNNLLWQAIDYAAKDSGISVSLDLTRFNGIVASRTDMDQAQQRFDVSPEGGGPGIYDKLLPILTQWKHDYNFVGSYYVDIGNNVTGDQYTDWAVSAPYYAQILTLGNELGTHSYTHPEDTNTLTAAQIQFEFQQSKQLLEQQMSAYLLTPFTISGAAVPGMPETLTTSEQIIQYFNYISGGYASVAAGYPGAFGFLTPGLTNAVYLAPNTSFDFSLVEYQKLGAEGAAAAWAQEWNQLVANANIPIVVWPWHDYGPTAWAVNDGVTSPYTTQMFTDWIQRAYLAGDEFVTAADLASRIQSFAQSDVTSTVNGNVITVSVASAHAGAFALNVAGQGTQVIQNVANWYAYDNDSLFLPEIGGNYTITLGTAADDVTHITALPMRGDLLSVTGDRLNLSFSMIGEGDVFIDLGLGSATSTPIVTGATIVSRVGDLLDLTLTGLGQHDVSLLMTVPLPTEVVSTLLFSADTGSSAIDFVTNTAAQTILGTLSAALGLGDVVQLSLDNGATWLAATATAGTATFSLPGVTLTATSRLSRS
jgi:serralysin